MKITMEAWYEDWDDNEEIHEIECECEDNIAFNAVCALGAFERGDYSLTGFKIAIDGGEAWAITDLFDEDEELLDEYGGSFDLIHDGWLTTKLMEDAIAAYRRLNQQ